MADDDKEAMHIQLRAFEERLRSYESLRREIDLDADNGLRRWMNIGDLFVRIPSTTIGKIIENDMRAITAEAQSLRERIHETGRVEQ
ncbi:P53 and DNA damage-regulated protein 1 [Plasmodiophora brassicae]|uniref:P53 and DNA damage-regulated protein 1 n=1 Tax=Plasmodiophora brassicae TaxID=37360 RepID=A0A0G4J1Y3_PLABS|nr:hypothetical protein PBRA_002148 [Plasmodiophora brassicae]SPQ93184.1 unnamed protein product [Plasmodiophora brassicae]